MTQEQTDFIKSIKLRFYSFKNLREDYGSMSLDEKIAESKLWMDLINDNFYSYLTHNMDCPLTDE